MSLEKFIQAASFAQESYGCFVVVNALLFSEHDAATIERVRDAADEAGLRFNLDLGYDPAAPSQTFDHDGDAARAVPLMRTADALSVVTAHGGDPELTKVALVGLTSPLGRPCGAGHDYLFIDIHGQVYRCSRYAVLDRQSYGNVLDPGFEPNLRQNRWAPCGATAGCCNKEDFLNLRVAEHLRSRDVPSLGWTDA